MNWFFLLLAFLIGMSNTIQSGVNGQLKVALDNPILSALISFAVGFFALLAAYLFFNQSSFPTMESFRELSWWKLTGGLFGAFYVVTVVFIIRDIGPANMICLVVAGQMLAAIVIDHFGLQGFTPHPVSWPRIFGAVLVIGGVYLILKH
jgi:transporter family-2 protein